MTTSTDADAFPAHPQHIQQQFWLSQRIFVPAPVYIPTEQQPPQSYSAAQLSKSYWFLCKCWLRYHLTQLRWDIERTIARLRHQRWGA
jgi:hypothetical protein